jgi:hypothetical protein
MKMSDKYKEALVAIRQILNQKTFASALVHHHLATDLLFEVELILSAVVPHPAIRYYKKGVGKSDNVIRLEFPGREL